MVENEGCSLLQAEFFALAWEKHVSGATMHSVCATLRHYAKIIENDATVRIRFALEDGFPVYLESKIKLTIISVNLKRL